MKMLNEEMDVDEFIALATTNKFCFDASRRGRSLQKLLRGTCRQERKPSAVTIHHLAEDFRENTNLDGKGGGRGVVVTSDGFLITAFHVMPTDEPFGDRDNPTINKRIIVHDARSASFLDPTVYVALPEHDLLLLRMLNPRWEGRPVLSLGSRSAVVGHRVTVFGTSVKKTEVEWVGDFAGGDSSVGIKNHDVAITSALDRKGCSGSPVFVSSGKLVGIATFTHWPRRTTGVSYRDGQGYVCFRKIRYIRQLIESAIRQIRDDPSKK